MPSRSPQHPVMALLGHSPVPTDGRFTVSMFAASNLPEVIAVLRSRGGRSCKQAISSQVTNQIIKGVGQMVETFGSEYAPYRGYGRCAVAHSSASPPKTFHIETVV